MMLIGVFNERENKHAEEMINLLYRIPNFIHCNLKEIVTESAFPLSFCYEHRNITKKFSLHFV